MLDRPRGGQHVALRRGRRWRASIGSRSDPGRAGRRGRPGGSNRRGPRSFRRNRPSATARRGRARGTRPRSPLPDRAASAGSSPSTSWQDAAEVGDRARLVAWAPGLAPDQMGHVAVGVERLDEATRDRVLPVLPAELVAGPVGPELEGLRLHRRRGFDGAAEALVALDQLAADSPQGPDRDPEHDLVEVGAADQRHGVAPERVRVELEVDALFPQRLAVGELLPARLARPAPQVLDVDERVVARRSASSTWGTTSIESTTGSSAATPEPGDRMEELGTRTPRRRSTS